MKSPIQATEIKGKYSIQMVKIYNNFIELFPKTENKINHNLKEREHKIIFVILIIFYYKETNEEKCKKSPEE